MVGASTCAPTPRPLFVYGAIGIEREAGARNHKIPRRTQKKCRRLKNIIKPINQRIAIKSNVVRTKRLIRFFLMFIAKAVADIHAKIGVLQESAPNRPQTIFPVKIVGI